jgi:hypothetical protein
MILYHSTVNPILPSDLAGSMACEGTAPLRTGETSEHSHGDGANHNNMQHEASTAAPTRINPRRGRYFSSKMAQRFAPGLE